MLEATRKCRKLCRNNRLLLLTPVKPACRPWTVIDPTKFLLPLLRLTRKIKLLAFSLKPKLRWMKNTMMLST
jgi:hypothetical protein